MWGRHAARTPREPIFSDQRVLGLSLGTRARLFVVFAVIVAVTGGASFMVFRQQVHDAHVKGQRQIAALACLLVSLTPPGFTLVDEIRAQYDCPPYARPRAASSSTPRPPSIVTRTRTVTAPHPTPGTAQSPPAGSSHATPQPPPSRTSATRTEPPRGHPSKTTGKPRPSGVGGLPVVVPPIDMWPLPPQAVDSLCMVVPVLCTTAV